MPAIARTLKGPPRHRIHQTGVAYREPFPLRRHAPCLTPRRRRARRGWRSAARHRRPRDHRGHERCRRPHRPGDEQVPGHEEPAVHRRCDRSPSDGLSRGPRRERLDGEAVPELRSRRAPRSHEVVAASWAWAPGTGGGGKPVTGPVVRVDASTPESLEAYRAKVKGAWVMLRGPG